MSYLSTLDNYASFSAYQHPSREEVFSYIDLMYNLESQLITDYQDINIRKQVAAERAGLDRSQEWVKNILMGMDAEFNALVFCYIGEIQNNSTFQLLNTAEELFAEINAVINEKVKKMSINDDKFTTTMKNKADLLGKAEGVSDQIKKYRKELFSKELGLDPSKIQPRKKIAPENV